MSDNEGQRAGGAGAVADPRVASLQSENAELRAELAAARDEVREERDNHHTLVEGLPLYVFHKDLQLRHFDVSPNLARRLGLPPGGVVGKKDTDMSPGALGEKYQRDDRHVIETGQVFEDIEEHNPVAGEPTYIQTRKMPLRNAKGEIVGVQGWFFDVTSIKMAELALQKRTGELEAALEQLRSNQEQLFASEKMASLGRLTAGIAHEMNTPLAAVRAALNEIGELVSEYARSIGDEGVSQEDHREISRDLEASVTLAKNAAARASAFVRGIKAQTRNVTGQLAVDFDAVQVIAETLLLLGHLVRAAKCDLVFQPQLPAYKLSGTPGRLGQVVTNLVTNAVDALRDKGGGKVVVDLTPETGGVCLSVQDDGTGIPAELLGRIFEPMFTTKPFGEGTGLGLSIVRDIVSGEFSGSIEVKSEASVGTTFLVHLRDRTAQDDGNGGRHGS